MGNRFGGNMSLERTLRQRFNDFVFRNTFDYSAKVADALVSDIKMPKYSARNIGKAVLAAFLVPTAAVTMVNCSGY